MFRLSLRLRAVVLAALTACAVAPALAQSRRPTPREAIERNLAPVSSAMRDLTLTDEERARLADVTDRAEAWAAEMVHAEHHRDQTALRARARRMAMLARVVRARVEAMRAEAAAVEAERAVVTSVERRAQARAALERAAEQQLTLERGAGAMSTYALPAPDVDAGVGAPITRATNADAAVAPEAAR